ncbi:MAG: adenylate kinase [Nanoarchaeota archaeon]|nr:adenylate kinase [Nanoarchaeota archaeon]
MLNLLIFGPPGSGKGTQAAKISAEYRIPHISTGTIFREAYAQKTDLGIEVRERYWGRGILVPDDVTNTLAFARLQQDDCQQGFILDGYPRTQGQADNLQEFLSSEGKSIDHVLYLKCAQEMLVGRIATRFVCQDCNATYGMEVLPKEKGKCDVCPGELYHRLDDAEDKIGTRITEYLTKTAPLLDFYQQQGLLREIDGAQHVEDVFEEIERILKI